MFGVSGELKLDLDWPEVSGPHPVVAWEEAGSDRDVNLPRRLCRSVDALPQEGHDRFNGDQASGEASVQL